VVYEICGLRDETSKTGVRQGDLLRMHPISEQTRQHLMTRPTECEDDQSSIERKIEIARDLHAARGDAMRRDPSIRNLLGKLERNIETSREVMLSLGIVEACKHCDEKEGGSCCGAGLENKFDRYLLLMNLLLGVSLPDYHCRPNSCYLLAAEGCLLKARLILCVDFLCPKILGTLTREELIKLQEISGDELVSGFMLYDAVKRFLRRSTSTNLV
jgi:hypothetical protein